MRAGLCFSAAFLLAASLPGQQASNLPALPAALPSLGPLRTVSPPKVKEYRLANGMEIWFVQRANLPKVQMTLLLKGGDSLDPPELPGLAQVLATAVTQGTATRSARQIADAAEFTGGEISADADVDSMELGIDSLSEYTDQALALLQDISQNVAFSSEQLAATRSHLRNALLAQQADPHFLARRALFGVLYPGNPYGTVAPTAATVQNFTSDNLRTLYRQTFRPDRALLIAVGQFQPEMLLRQIKKDFGDWKGSGSAVAGSRPPARKIDHRVYIVDRPNSVQATMLIAAMTPTLHDPAEPVLELADAIYGSGFNSRLRKNIREDKGYSYHPGSAIETHRWSATVETTEDVRNAVTGPSLKETFYELQRMSTEPPSGQELINGKRYLIGNIALRIHSRPGMAAILGEFWIQGVPADFLETEMQTVQRATTAQVRRAAAEYLAPQRMTVVAVGEKKVIEGQLQSFGMPILDIPPVR
ncbi:MAG: pitrilysin family protein [Acidobacteriaceae bacterium]